MKDIRCCRLLVSLFPSVINRGSLFPSLRKSPSISAFRNLRKKFNIDTHTLALAHLNSILYTFLACQLYSWLVQSKSVFTGSSASIFFAGARNGLYPGEFYNNGGKILFSTRKLCTMLIIINLTLKH